MTEDAGGGGGGGAAAVAGRLLLSPTNHRFHLSSAEEAAPRS